MAKMFVRAGFPFNYDQEAASDESGLRCLDPSLAQQHMKEEADINVIVERFGLTGMVTPGRRVPSFGDFMGPVFDFQSAQNAVVEAREAFMELPAQVRARFANDPQQFLEFVEERDQDGKRKNFDELVKLGLAVRPNEAPLPREPVEPEPDEDDKED